MATAPIIQKKRKPASMLALSLFTISIIVGLVSMQAYLRPESFNLRYNGYAMISVASLLANLTVLILLSRLRSKTDTSIWFGFYVSCVAFFGFGEALQRLSANPHGALFWAQFSSIGIILAPVALFIFASSHANNLRPKLALIPLFVMCAAVVIFFNANGSLIYTVDLNTLHLYPWGYNNQIGPAFVLHAGWILILYASAIVILLRSYFSTQEELLRRQTLLFAVAVSIPWAVSAIVDGILPLFGIVLVPCAAATVTITGILILIGFKKFSLFTIDQELLSGSILATMKEAVIVTRPDHRIDTLNSEAEIVLKTQANSLYRQSLQEFFEDDAWTEIISKHVSAPGTAGTGQGFQTKLKGTGVPVRVTASSLEELGTIAGYVFVISDISELTASLERLAAEKRNIEHIVEVRTQALRKAHEDLKAADQLKTEFIILTSHNLRTPLASLIAGIDMLKNDTLPVSSRELAVNVLDDSGKRLGNLIESMLTISQLEAGEQSVLKPTSIDEVVRPLLAEAEKTATSNGLALKTDIAIPPDTMINCNVLRLQNSLRNIIDNAFKFTKTGSIYFHVSLKQNQVSFIITDTGIGISQDELSKLFTSFHRGTDTMHFDYQGEGIGLYFTKLVIEEHNGSITVDSKPNEGTTVTVTLPVI